MVRRWKKGTLDFAKFSFSEIIIFVFASPPINNMNTAARQDPYGDCPQILRDYLFYMQTIKGRSERTVMGYYIDLRTFFRFLSQYKGFVPADMPFEDISISSITLDVLRDVTLSDLYEYLHYVSSERSNSPVTRSRKVSSIKSFFHYCTSKTKLLENDPTIELEVPSVRKSLPKYLTLEQCLELLKSVDGEFRERDYCMITLFLNCGMRLSELVGINLSDLKENTVRLLGKGNKERIVYLNDACLDALQGYQVYRNTHPIHPAHRNALFLTQRGTRIGARRVEQIIDENLKKAGLDQYGFSTHKLRHTAATMMYQHGNVDIKALQAILGHANLGTTEIYTHLSSQQLEQAAQSTPLSRLPAPKPRKPKSSGSSKKPAPEDENPL